MLRTYLDAWPGDVVNLLRLSESLYSSLYYAVNFLGLVEYILGKTLWRKWLLESLRKTNTKTIYATSARSSSHPHSIL